MAKWRKIMANNYGEKLWQKWRKNFAIISKMAKKMFAIFAIMAKMARKSMEKMAKINGEFFLPFSPLRHGENREK